MTRTGRGAASASTRSTGPPAGTASRKASVSCWIRGRHRLRPAPGERRGDQPPQPPVVGRVRVQHVPEQARGHARRQLGGVRAREQSELLDDVRVGQHRAHVRVAGDQPPGVAARQRDPHGRACGGEHGQRGAPVGVRRCGEQRGGGASRRRRRWRASCGQCTAAIGAARIGERYGAFCRRGRASAPPRPPRGATARRAGPGSRRRGCRRSAPTARAGPRSRRWSARRRSARGRRAGGGSGRPGARACPRWDGGGRA